MCRDMKHNGFCIAQIQLPSARGICFLEAELSFVSVKKAGKYVYIGSLSPSGA